MARALATLALLWTALVAADAWRDGYRLAMEPHRFRFPRDHASHPDYRVEWWYYTGHLAGGGRAFGYQLTFFRVGVSRAWESSPSAWAPHTVLFAHLALTDEDRKRFRFHERIRRPALGLAGADSTRYHVWVEDWSGELAADGRTHRLRARADDLALDLSLAPLKPPVVHGADGLSRKSATPGNASHYYSFTRLDTQGTMRVDNESLAVSGLSWMDHEFSTSQLDSTQVGWDWFSLQLDSGEDLMLYRMRRRDGTVDPVSSGTWIARDGRVTHLPREAFEVRVTAEWRSPHSGATYPHGWEVRVPRFGLEVSVTPAVDDQELVTRRTGGVVYWEGSVRVRGKLGPQPSTGQGYVELTGYAGAAPGL